MPAAEPPKPAGRSVRRDFLFALAVLGCVLTGLTALTWRKWPDMLLDFGLQLYLPWRISTGAVLYRDLAYMTGGPLSQYFDASLFRLFGVSFLTLALANLALLLLLLGLVYRCFYQAADQLTALVCCLAILLVFAFNHYSDYGIFNYVTPYSQEIYHGLILSIAAVALLAKWAAAQKRSAALAAGFCCGLVFLTKPEVFLAVAAAVLAALFLAWRITRKWETAVKGLGLMTLAGAVPPLAFLVYFLRFADLQQSLKWTCWAWVPVLASSAAKSPLYRWCLGMDAPGFHLARMLGDFLGLVAIVVLGAVLFRRRGRSARDAAVFMLVAAPLAALAWRFDWVECAHSLPLLCLTTLAFLLWRARSAGWNPSAIFMVLWTVMSLVLLAKLGFYCRIWHYGFALAMPAFLTAICLLLRLAPEFLQRWAVPPNWWRGLASILLLTGFAQLILFSKYVYQQKTVPVGKGADMLWTFRPEFRPSGALMEQALSWMQTNAPPGSTLAVLPAGVMLNYMLRCPNPTPYLRWNPPELAVFGQANMTRAMEQSKPDYIFLLGVDTSEFGVNFFGDTDSFGRGLLRWIKQAYQPVCLIGHDWAKDGQFGIKILKRTGAHALDAH
jgi:4-amino-4-deoxy-L-arabinose transferase-like glycosyltransferase